MIKTFEEFVNEDYDARIFNSDEMYDYLKKLGINNRDLKYIFNLADKHGFYSATEIDDILKRLPGCDSIEDISKALKTIFYGTDDDLKKWIGNVKCPIVRSVEGLLLTGSVWYFPQYDLYANDTDDFFEEEFYQALCQFTEENEEYEFDIYEMDDYDFIEFCDKLIDDGIIVDVDLDKKFGWVDDGSWDKKWGTSKFLPKPQYAEPIR